MWGSRQLDYDAYACPRLESDTTPFPPDYEKGVEAWMDKNRFGPEHFPLYYKLTGRSGEFVELNDPWKQPVPSADGAKTRPGERFNHVKPPDAVDERHRRSASPRRHPSARRLGAEGVGTQLPRGQEEVGSLDNRTCGVGVRVTTLVRHNPSLTEAHET